MRANVLGESQSTYQVGRFLPWRRSPVGGNGLISTQRCRKKNEGYIYLGLMRQESSVLPWVFSKSKRDRVLMNSGTCQPALIGHYRTGATAVRMG